MEIERDSAKLYTLHIRICSQIIYMRTAILLQPSVHLFSHFMLVSSFASQHKTMNNECVVEQCKRACNLEPFAYSFESAHSCGVYKCVTCMMHYNQCHCPVECVAFCIYVNPFIPRFCLF